MPPQDHVAVAAGSVAPEGGEFTLRLAAPGAPRARRVAYQHALAHYTEIIGRSERVLKDWIAHGRYIDVLKKIPRVPADPPPFDDLPAMEAWWLRCMHNKCPECLTRFAQGADSAPSKTGQPSSSDNPSTEKTAAAGAPAAEDRSIPDFHDATDGNTDIGIQYLRGLVQSGIKEMNAAKAEDNSKRYWNARKQWKIDMEDLRKWEKDITALQEGKGEVLRARLINTAFVSIFGVIIQTFTNALLTLGAQLRPEMSAADLRALVLPHRDRIIGFIKKSRFAQVWEQSAPADLQTAA